MGIFGTIIWYLVSCILPYLRWAIIWILFWLTGTIVLFMLWNSIFKISYLFFIFHYSWFRIKNLIGVQLNAWIRLMLVLKRTVVVWFIWQLFTAFYLLHFVTHNNSNSFSNSNLASNANVLMCFCTIDDRRAHIARTHIFYISVCFEHFFFI